MILYKILEEAPWVRKVRGKPWVPGTLPRERDSTGDYCTPDTHFLTRAEALEKLREQALEWLYESGQAVSRQRQSLQNTLEDAADAASMYTDVENLLREL